MVAVTSTSIMFAALIRTIESLVGTCADLPTDRRHALDRAASFLGEQCRTTGRARVMFICTGNSRRSQLGQMWALAAARYYDLTNVDVYSGGTQVTATDPRTIAALRRAGFEVETPTGSGDNPHYRVRISDAVEPVESFSKLYDDASNPEAGFVAMLTCTDADRACPSVPGASLRVSLPYDDPRFADDTPAETTEYDARSRQIAAEMLYLFANVETQ